MTEFELLTLENEEHLTSIKRLIRDIAREKGVLKTIVSRIEDDTQGENDLENYGLINECSRKICIFIARKNTLQKLVLLKTKLFTENK